MNNFWNSPLGYRQNMVVIGSLWLVGFLIEYASYGQGVSIPPWPFNFFLLIGYTVLVVVASRIPLFKEFQEWSSSIPLTISATSSLGLLVLLSGILPQTQSTLPFLNRLGLTHLTNSWPYALNLIVVLNILLLISMKRSRPVTLKNTAFVLNHFGLWLVLVAASFGASDLVRLKMDLTENEVVWQSYDSHDNFYEMPFALELIKFHLQEYPASLVITEKSTRKIINQHLTPDNLLENNKTMRFDHYEIQVSEFLPLAFPVESRFVPVMDVGSAPAAKIKVTDQLSKESTEGWISTGSFLFAPSFVELKETALAMNIPKPQKFTSEIRIFTPDQKVTEATIEVNKPYSLQGWRLYQYGYDDKMGRWSKTSTIEAINDPWLPVVYLGFFLMLLGSLYLIIKGRVSS